VEQDYASGPLPRVAAPSLEENTATDEAQAADPCAIAVDAALEFVAATPAALAVIPLEDVLGLGQQANLPA
jgi:4-alpha-glucanotransferase